jgi:uncharacterized protein YyaL (SSP411 family)
MIDALARAGVVTGQPHYLEAASRAATFILQKMVRDGGRLLHTWRHGTAKLDAYLDDYAYLANALLTLYEATFHEPWIDEATRLADLLRQHFEDKAGGGFFFTADDHEQLIARNKDFHDASVPSGNGMAATALVRLGKLTGKTEYLESALGAIVAGLPVMERAPTASAQLLIALDMWLGPMQEWVLIGGNDNETNRELVAELRRSYLPHAMVAYRPGSSWQGADTGRSPVLDPLFAGRTAIDGQPTLFVCEDYACQAPLVGRESILTALKPAAG